jgi:Zn ribbon nucleic-acid-binding protein
MKMIHTCKNEECKHDIIVEYWSADRDGEAEIDTCECPKCGYEIDFEDIDDDFKRGVNFA